jgi:hypothetical protein
VLQQLLLLGGQRGEGGWQQEIWGWGLGSVLALLMVSVEIGHSYLDWRSRTCRALGGATQAPEDGEGDKVVPGGEQVGWLQVKVILVSVAAAVMAAVACLNWALAYVTCLVLMPLVAVTQVPAPPRAVDGSAGVARNCAAAESLPAGESSARHGTRQSMASRSDESRLRQREGGGVLRVLRWLSLVSCSPVAVLLLMAVAGGQHVYSAFQPTSMWWVVLESRFSSYAMFWAVYMPFWIVCCLLVWQL